MAKTKQKFDVIIIGGGPAGLSTALWCADLGLTSVVLERRREFGGQLINIHAAISNYPGRETANGREMRDIYLLQVKGRQIDLRTGVEITDIDLEHLSVTLSNEKVCIAEGLVVATGVRRRRLNVEGESEFYGKGILESGQRDKELVKDRRVLIVGGGDAALENAVLLAKKAKEICIVHRGDKFRARPEFVEEINGNPRVKVLFDSVITGFRGRAVLNGASITNTKTGKTDVLEIDDALIRVGIEPNTEFLNGRLELDRKGYIVVNSRCETTQPGVFAVGDVANPVSPTIISAAGMGSTAAKAISSRLNHREIL